MLGGRDILDKVVANPSNPTKQNEANSDIRVVSDVRGVKEMQN